MDSLINKEVFHGRYNTAFRPLKTSSFIIYSEHLHNFAIAQSIYPVKNRLLTSHKPVEHAPPDARLSYHEKPLRKDDAVNIALLGIPQSGKSTLFEAVTSTFQVFLTCYPLCLTIFAIMLLTRHLNRSYSGAGLIKVIGLRHALLSVTLSVSATLLLSGVVRVVLGEVQWGWSSLSIDTP